MGEKKAHDEKYSILCMYVLHSQRSITPWVRCSPKRTTVIWLHITTLVHRVIGLTPYVDIMQRCVTIRTTQLDLVWEIMPHRRSDSRYHCKDWLHKKNNPLHMGNMVERRGDCVFTMTKIGSFLFTLWLSCLCGLCAYTILKAKWTVLKIQQSCWLVIFFDWQHV